MRVPQHMLKPLDADLGDMWGRDAVRIILDDPRCPLCVLREGPAEPELRPMGSVGPVRLEVETAELRRHTLKGYGHCYAANAVCWSCGDVYAVVVEKHRG